MDAAVKTDGPGQGNTARYSNFPSQIGAADVHARNVTGDGITIAIIDSGMWKHEQLTTNSRGESRLLAVYDAVSGRPSRPKNSADSFGHGTHIASVAASSAVDSGKFNGAAPDANLVSVKAFDADGIGTYRDVIRGIEWVVNNKERYNIRVLNLSFSAKPQSHYWDDPLNQAVMAAWDAGIVVVASAGNTGPEAMTIGVPGNNPYVITVGAMTDNYTPLDTSDDVLASFSSAGPTYEGFVKPELVAPGGHALGFMDATATLARDHQEFLVEGSYFTMSGTSQAAAMVSGAAALLLQAKPWLTPDDVKCQLMATANPARSADGQLAYSVFQQGAGLVNVNDAIDTDILGCGNRGLDVRADIAGTAHFGGLANQDADGNY